MPRDLKTQFMLTAKVEKKTIIADISKTIHEAI